MFILAVYGQAGIVVALDVNLLRAEILPLRVGTEQIFKGVAFHSEIMFNTTCKVRRHTTLTVINKVCPVITPLKPNVNYTPQIS
jgi:hypothetical protein